MSVNNRGPGQGYVFCSRMMVEIRDKTGRNFQVLPCGEEGLEHLSSFYDEFEPKEEYQGIPPARKPERNRWVEGLLSYWENFLILDSGRVVGHVAVAVGEGPLQELIVFLHQDFRGRGIGSGALLHVRGRLEEKSHGRLWLTVQNTNTPAIRCFSKVGFKFTSPSLEPEREMVLDLESSD